MGWGWGHVICNFSSPYPIDATYQIVSDSSESTLEVYIIIKCWYSFLTLFDNVFKVHGVGPKVIALWKKNSSAFIWFQIKRTLKLFFKMRSSNYQSQTCRKDNVKIQYNRRHVLIHLSLSLQRNKLYIDSVLGMMFVKATKRRMKLRFLKRRQKWTEREALTTTLNITTKPQACF